MDFPAVRFLLPGVIARALAGRWLLRLVPRGGFQWLLLASPRLLRG